MSIEVVSATEVQAPVKTETSATQGEKKESALEAKASEHNQATESDTEASDTESDVKDESEEDADGDELSAESKDADKDKPKKKSGIQKRVDKLNGRVTAAQQEAEYWKSVALKNQGTAESKTEQVDKPKAQASSASDEPDPDDFETHAAYVKALASHTYKQEQKAAQAEEQKSKLMAEQQTKLQTYAERAKAFAEQNAEFAETLEAVDDVVVSGVVQELIVSSENGPELAFELAKNRQEFERINALGPIAAAREIGRLEARIAKASASSEETKPEPKKLTKAPAPITPVGSKGGKSEKSLSDPDLSQREYEAIRAKQIKQRQAQMA